MRGGALLSDAQPRAAPRSHLILLEVVKIAYDVVANNDIKKKYRKVLEHTLKDCQRITLKTNYRNCYSGRSRHLEVQILLIGHTIRYGCQMSLYCSQAANQRV